MAGRRLMKQGLWSVGRNHVGGEVALPGINLSVAQP